MKNGHIPKSDLMSRASSPPPQKRRRDDTDSSFRPPSNGSPSSTRHEVLPPLSLSILGVEPLDEFIKEVADFVHHTITTRPDYPNSKVEVEAKIGVVLDRTTKQRLALPVCVETILPQDMQGVQFESNMTVHQHMHFNKLLNELKERSSQPNYPSTPLSYQHLYLVDSFYPHDGNERDKIRVTRNERTKEVECTRKVRLGDLNVYSPRRQVDWRVSVNLEVPVQHPVGSAFSTRRKDRMSYAHEEFLIDLTQVTMTTSPNSPPQLLHELEVEIARSELLLGTAARRGDPNVPEHERSAFDELIRAFVNNARILVRNA